MREEKVEDEIREEDGVGQIMEGLVLLVEMGGHRRVWSRGVT